MTFNLYRTRLPPPLRVHTSHRICTNLRIKSRAGWGQLPLFTPLWRR